MSTRVGDILLEAGKVSNEQLKEALDLQNRIGGRLLWLLASLGHITRPTLFSTLAQHFNLDFALLNDKDIRAMDKTLLKDLTVETIFTYQAVPKGIGRDTLELYTAYPENQPTLQFFAQMFPGKEIHQIVITDMDLLRIITSHFNEKIVDNSIFGLYYRSPQESALAVFGKRQTIAIAICCLALLLAFSFYPVSTLKWILLLINAFYMLNIAFRLLLSMVGARSEILQLVTDEEVQALEDETLPIYSVIIPAYNEPGVMPYLIEGISNLDYPQNKLDVLLILEENDNYTLEAAKKASPPSNWRFIIVPDVQPKTKPKACNYGVHFARGEYVTIYDAEDIPEPDQLKKALVAFRKNPPGKYICFQAALNYFNADQNIITRFFTLEYSYWFDYLLPGLDKLNLPIPLGGTSNHFDLQMLKDLGAWDPFNTTEDADLGIRAAAEGYRVGVINSTTFEEANSRYYNWIRQRSRWIKGYMQTALVFNRRPLQLLRDVGPKNWLAFQIFITGTPILFLVNPIMWGFFLIWAMTQAQFMEPYFLPVTTFIGLTNLVVGNFLGIYLNCLAVFRRRYFKLLPYALLNPFYWLFFHTPAAYKALWQLFVKPHYWEKTTHGLSDRDSRYDL